MSLFFPTIYLDSVTAITTELMEQHHIHGLILDIDNTLTTHNNPSISLEISAWLTEMKRRQIPLVILSNNRRVRVEPFAEKIGLDFIGMGMKPFKKGYKKACEKLRLPPQQVAMVGDQLFTDICGANRLGIPTIYVEPILDEGSFFFSIKRYLERKVFYRYFNQKGSKR